jgi:hypothetical protein
MSIEKEDLEKPFVAPMLPYSSYQAHQQEGLGKSVKILKQVGRNKKCNN